MKKMIILSSLLFFNSITVTSFKEVCLSICCCCLDQQILKSLTESPATNNTLSAQGAVPPINSHPIDDNLPPSSSEDPQEMPMTTREIIVVQNLSLPSGINYDTIRITAIDAPEYEAQFSTRGRRNSYRLSLSNIDENSMTATSNAPHVLAMS